MSHRLRRSIGAMDVAAELVIAKLRCAPFHESLHVDPIGSAGAYDAFLCVEVPLPWERDISMNEPFRSLIDIVGAATTGPDRRRWRPQGLVGSSASAVSPGGVRVTAFEQPTPSDGAASYQRREWLLPQERVVDLGAALIQGDTSALAAFDGHGVAVDASVLDVFVCTHGKRDSCCGNYGMELFTDLAAVHRSNDHTGAGGVRVRRVSHTGGHRFAPTALTFPDGYAWAHLDRDLAEAVIARTGETSGVAPHCRGLSSLEGGPAQAADRAALIAVGWAWTSARRHVMVVAFDRVTMATTVRIDGEWPDGSARAFVVQVGIERHVPQTTCGLIDGPEYTVEPVWSVTSVEPVAPQVRSSQ